MMALGSGFYQDSLFSCLISHFFSLQLQLQFLNKVVIWSRFVFVFQIDNFERKNLKILDNFNCNLICTKSKQSWSRCIESPMNILEGYFFQIRKYRKILISLKIPNSKVLTVAFSRFFLKFLTLELNCCRCSWPGKARFQSVKTENYKQCFSALNEIYKN